MELADEKYVAEADPEKQLKGARLEKKTADPRKRIRIKKSKITLNLIF